MSLLSSKDAAKMNAIITGRRHTLTTSSSGNGRNSFMNLTAIRMVPVRRAIDTRAHTHLRRTSS